MKKRNILIVFFIILNFFGCGAISTAEGELTCSLKISCETILDNMDSLTSGKEELIPEDGVILSLDEVRFSEGETVFDVLLREVTDRKIHMEYSVTPLYNSVYIEGINNIYEFDCGSLSGWMYSVNGEFPSFSSSEYTLEDGDSVWWQYSCDLGKDIGEEFEIEE